MHAKTRTPDADLLRQYVAGQTAALGELAERYERLLLGLAAGLLGGRRDLAADAVQELWVRVIRFGSGFKGQSSVKTWLYRILVNQCRTLAAARAPGAGPAEPHAERAADPRRPVEDADRNHIVRRAVDGLEEERRAVVLLCYHARMTHEEAAEILELPLGTLKSRLHAALTELRAVLSPEVHP